MSPIASAGSFGATIEELEAALPAIQRMCREEIADWIDEARIVSLEHDHDAGTYGTIGVDLPDHWEHDATEGLATEVQNLMFRLSPADLVPYGYEAPDENDWDDER